ncbi:hypothetical protein Tco_1212513 [Tanacetum coccineum]
MGLQPLQLELRLGKNPSRSFRPVKSAEILWQFWTSYSLRVSLAQDGSWSKYESEVNSRGLHQDGKEKTVISSDLTSSHLKRRHASHGESTLIGVHKPIQRPTIDAQMIKGNGRQRLND